MATFRPTIVDTERARLPQKNYPRQALPPPAVEKSAPGGGLPLIRGFSPIVLSSGDTSLVAGGTGVPDHGRLQPHERSPMFIDEIHFSVRMTDTGGAINTPVWAIRAKFDMGRLALTRGYVPIGNFEYVWLNNTMLSPTAAGSAFANNSVTGVRWRLPKPQFVPAGSLLSCSLAQSIYGIASSSFVDVTYVGRLLPIDYPTPEVIDVPYVTAVYKDAVTSPLYSQDLELGNPFEMPMYAQRLTMRHVEAATRYIEQATTIPTVTLRGTIKNQDIEIARDIPYNVLLDDRPASGQLGHRTFELFNGEMAPKDRFEAAITWANTTSSPLASIALIGWRRERL